MKNITAILAAGAMALLACGSAFAQTPNQIPVGAAAGVSRQSAGSRFRNPTNPPQPAATPAPVATPATFSWTGVYLGGDFGGSFASTSIESNTKGWASRTLNPTGVMGGAYVGYNYQVSPNFVLGLEGDFQGNSSSANVYYPTFDVTPSTQQNWIASLNGRLGVAYDRALFYAIGGAAWSQASATITPGLVRFPPTAAPISRTADVAGWDVGAGVDYAFNPHWVGRLEYRYYDFGSFNATNARGYLPLQVQTSANTFRVGLAYLFGAPASAVAAKY